MVDEYLDGKISLRVNKDEWELFKSIAGEKKNSILLRQFMRDYCLANDKEELKKEIILAKTKIKEEQTRLHTLETKLKEIEELEQNKELQNKLLLECYNTCLDMANSRTVKGVSRNEIKRVAALKNINSVLLEQEIKQQNTIKIISEKETEINSTLKSNNNNNGGNQNQAINIMIKLIKDKFKNQNEFDNILEFMQNKKEDIMPHIETQNNNLEENEQINFYLIKNIIEKKNY